jgi:hypothetical protein
MDRTREKKMSKGVILFAFNSPKINYYDMAVSTAKRINHFLDLPVTIVTDVNSIPTSIDYSFDNTITTVADSSNKRDKETWINKGRYQAFELTPYDETLLIDTDYLINSSKLLKTFELPTDFCCHDTTHFLMNPTDSQEMINVYGIKTSWATVVRFNKSKRAECIFKSIEMVQRNYEHYANLHSFIPEPYRNDYAITLATNIANGNTTSIEDIIPWNLIHVGKNTTVYKNTDNIFNTEYTVMFDNWKKGKIRKEYSIIKDMDFHVMNKENFLELVA